MRSLFIIFILFIFVFKIKIIIGNKIWKKVDVKLLGVTIDREFKLDKHVS